jgi:ribosomal protein S18 acetylase RimI-like enzyme
LASYRFCRSDDVPLLVRAHELCLRPHFPSLPELTVAGLKQAVREIDVWTSSCLVAAEGDEPIAVLLATKREAEALVWRIGVRPGHERRGHGRHLVTSLGAKLAILGPPRILAEVPGSLGFARAFFESCGFRREVDYTDWVLDPPPGNPTRGAELVSPVGVEDLVDAGAFALAPPRAWSRTSKTLLQRKDSLRGLAVIAGERIEAWLLHEDDAAERTILAFACTDPGRTAPWLDLLVRSAAARDPRPLRIPRLHPDEIASAALRAAGFEPREITAGYAVTATPA